MIAMAISIVAISIVIHVMLPAFISVAVAMMMALVPGRRRQGEECSTQRCGKSNGDFPHDLSPSSSSIGGLRCVTKQCVCHRAIASLTHVLPN
jgi:hypothetical protein